jgi:hypothetical protein
MRPEKFSLDRGVTQMSWIFTLVITLPAVAFAFFSLQCHQAHSDRRKPSHVISKIGRRKSPEVMSPLGICAT